MNLCLEQPCGAIISDTVTFGNEVILKDHIGSLCDYGWAARFLQLLMRDKQLLNFLEALKKVTSFPAESLGRINSGML